MPLDTQTFDLSRWWARSGLDNVSKNPTIFSNAHMRDARLAMIAGNNQLTGIKNWLSTARLIEKVGKGFEISRYGQYIKDNDPAFEKSATWWAIHLLVCTDEDPFPYDALFRVLDPSYRTFLSWKDLIGQVCDLGGGRSEASVETYLQGVCGMFRQDGALEGLNLVEVKRGRMSEAGGGNETFYRMGTPIVPTEAILFGVALIRQKYFLSRSSLDFGELVAKGLNNFLCMTQDDLRKRLKEISVSDRWRKEIQFSDAANLESLSFGDQFNSERMLVTLLQEGADSWM